MSRQRKQEGEKNLVIYHVKDQEFRQYGRIIDGIDVSELLEAMKETPVPEEVIYVPSDERLEKLPVYEIMTRVVYGNMPVQIGYCNGHNSLLNALEYHRSSEINVAVTDMILLLGKQQDIGTDYTYDTEKVQAFFVPQNTVIEVYATTLHYAPCGVDNNAFKCVVVLPRGTNYEVEPMGLCGEDKLLAAANKWLISHKDARIDGAFVGLTGDNISVDGSVLA